MAAHKPPALRPGDALSVVAPSGPFPREAFDAGLKVLAGRYRPVLDPGIFDAQRYLAGTDERRARELNEAISAPDRKALICARGGYGAMRLLRSLTFSPERVKALVGFSDTTALHLAAQRAGWVSVHAPVVTQLGRQPASVHQRLFHLLESPTPAPPLEAQACFVPGAVEGPLLGGNLEVFSRLLGTPFMPDLRGAVLLLEDTGERPYRLDRLWTHLELAGVFAQVAGIALGSFTHCEEKDAGYSSMDVLRELAAQTRLPCAWGFHIGHGEINEPVALGARVRLDATGKALHFLEGAVTAEPSA